MGIQELREEINGIDRTIVEMYRKRMETAARIGEWKKENGVPVLDRERERSLLNRVGEMAGEEYETGVRALFNLLIDQSRTKQLVDMADGEKIPARIRETLERTPKDSFYYYQKVIQNNMVD